MHTGTTSRWVVYLGTGLAVATAIAVVGAIQRWIELPTAILLYLVPIIFAASRWGRGPAIVAAVLSVTLHNVLFVEPVGTLTIDHPVDLFSLVLLLFTALVTAQLADSARQRSQAERDASVARQSDELKTALLRTVSHELRTPLASIKAAISGLRDAAGSYSDADRSELFAGIEEESDRLDRLVANLLDASRLESGALVPRFAPNDLRELVNAVVLRILDRFPERTILVEIPDDLPEAACEYGQIEQVVRNLIENAVIHTDRDVQVTIRSEREAEMLRTSISDTGAGIPLHDRARLFLAFERGATRSPGSGLGLTIAKGFVDAHGGRLWIEDGNSHGTTANFTLPIWKEES